MTAPSQPLLSVSLALTRILENFSPLEIETISLAQAAGRVLAEEIIADQDIPAFSNSGMDGYAVQVDAVAGASRENPVTLPVSGDIPAGSSRPTSLAPGTVMRIMTGAPVPDGAEAVIPVEDTDDRRDRAHAGAPPPAVVRFYTQVVPQTNIRPVGQGMRRGETVLRAGESLRAAAVGVLASLGQVRVKVYRSPLIAILSTGDELVEAEQTPGPGQIRESNGYALAAAVERLGARVLRLGIARDRAEQVREKLLHAVEAKADLIVSSAGVSVGAYDVVKEVVAAEGALNFWRVNMRPGKPLAFGQVRGTPFFGLPGNPVSALVTFEVFVRPAILKMGGRRATKMELQARVLEPIHSDGRESYLRAVVEWQAGELVVRITGDQGSAILTSLVRANALLIVPEGVLTVPAGELARVWLMDEG